MGQPRGSLLSWVKGEELLKQRELLGGGYVSKRAVSQEPGLRSRRDSRLHSGVGASMRAHDK